MESVFHGLYYGGEERRNYVGNDHAHRAGHLATQSAGDGINLITQLACYGQHPLGAYRAGLGANR